MICLPCEKGDHMYCSFGDCECECHKEDDEI
jgi:hypothetical protein